MKACANFIQLNKYIPPLLVREVRNLVLSCVDRQQDIFHNHDEDGRHIFRYPKVQYKIIRGKVCLLGIDEVTEAVANLKIPSKWDLNGYKAYVKSRRILYNDLRMFVDGTFHLYEFVTPWVALNKENYQKYRELKENCSIFKQRRFLEKLLRNEIITVAKGIKSQLRGKIEVKVFNPTLVRVSFKNVPFMGFYLAFATNVYIPPLLGIGRCVSHGFGTIKRIN